MKLIIRIALIICVLIFTTGSHSPTIASDPLLEKIQFEKTSNNEEKVLFVLNGFYPPEVFGLQGKNPRIVCDFLNTRLDNSVDSLMETNGDFIQRIRVGVHASPCPKIRVVLDLVPNQTYDIQQMFFQKENIFSITVRPDGAKCKD